MVLLLAFAEINEMSEGTSFHGIITFAIPPLLLLWGMAVISTFVKAYASVAYYRLIMHRKVSNGHAAAPSVNRVVGPACMSAFLSATLSLSIRAIGVLFGIFGLVTLFLTWLSRIAYAKAWIQEKVLQLPVVRCFRCQPPKAQAEIDDAARQEMEKQGHELINNMKEIILVFMPCAWCRSLLDLVERALIAVFQAFEAVTAWLEWCRDYFRGLAPVYAAIQNVSLSQGAALASESDAPAKYAVLNEETLIWKMLSMGSFFGAMAAATVATWIGTFTPLLVVGSFHSEHRGILIFTVFVAGYLFSSTILAALETCNSALLVHYVENLEKRAPEGAHLKVDNANFSRRFSMMAMV